MRRPPSAPIASIPLARTTTRTRPITLPATDRAVVLARNLGVRVTRRWSLQDLAEDTQLIVSELTTNASAPRGALSYPRYNREELKGGSWA